MEPLLYILEKNEDCLFGLQFKLGPDVPSLVDDMFVYQSFNTELKKEYLMLCLAHIYSLYIHLFIHSSSNTYVPQTSYISS